MFHKTINQIAIQTAVLFFFLMAGVGWAYGLSPGVCSTRALLGAGAGYVFVRFAGQLVVRVLIWALVDDQLRRYQDKNQGS